VNEDEMQALEPQAGETLERMLARYARVRLDPSAAASKRARSAVMEEAWRRRLDLVDAGTPTAAVPAQRRRRRLFASWSARRISVSLAAAMLAGLLLGSTAFAASRAGGPLYDTRLALEELTLPSDPASRVEVEIAWAQARLAEIVEASSRDDQGALSAALAAYERTVDTLGATTGEPADRALEAVASHRAVLARVRAAAPASVLGGLDRALAASDTAIGRLTATEAGQPGDGAGGANGNPAGGGGANGNPAGAGGANGNPAGAGGANGGGNGGANGNPAGGGGANSGGNGTPTGPHASATPKPEATPKPDHAPAPRPTKATDDTQRQTAPPTPASPATGKP
jgi:hypothetical protein